MKFFYILILLFSASIFHAQNNGLNFDGTNDYLSGPYAFGSDYTMEVWVKFEGSVANKGLIVSTTSSRLGALSNWSTQLRTDAAGHFVHYVWDGSTKLLLGSTVAVVGTWYHVAITCSVGGHIRLFVNGVEEGTSVSVSNVWRGPVVQFGVHTGGSGLSGANFFDGTMDEVRIWNSVRDAASIQSTMNQELLGNEADLGLYFPLNEGVAGANNTSITTASDMCSGANHSTLRNFSLTGTSSNWVGSSLVLPVDLLHFNAIKKEQASTLEWATATESNNRGFEVQKSADGERWESIAFVDSKGSGTSLRLNEYNYTDKHLLSGVNYYRLKQLDFDGSYAYSKVVSVSTQKVQDLDVRLYPNPITDKFVIEGLNEAQISITDNTGREVIKSQYQGEHFDISQLNSGLYFVQIVAQGVATTRKIYKK